jgi:hypothetical protein
MLSIEEGFSKELPPIKVYLREVTRGYVIGNSSI